MNCRTAPPRDRELAKKIIIVLYGTISARKYDFTLWCAWDDLEGRSHLFSSRMNPNRTGTPSGRLEEVLSGAGAAVTRAELERRHRKIENLTRE